MKRFRTALDDAGFSTMAWPKEYGGQDQGRLLPLHPQGGAGVLGDALRRALRALGGTTIMRFGSESQKQEWLPKIQTGEMNFAIGYTEPNAGTDLASLQTRAVRDGDEWVLNGQKIYTSAAHNASHLFMAARTDPEAPKHRGISVFVFPMDTPGITVRPLLDDGRRPHQRDLLRGRAHPRRLDRRRGEPRLVHDHERARPRARHDRPLRADQARARPDGRLRARGAPGAARRPDRAHEACRDKARLRDCAGAGDNQRGDHRRRPHADDGGLDDEGLVDGHEGAREQPGYGTCSAGKARCRAPALRSAGTSRSAGVARRRPASAAARTTSSGRSSPTRGLNLPRG